MSNSALNKDGEVVDLDSKHAVARIVNGMFSIKVSRGTLIDPYGIDSSKITSSEFKRVSEPIYRMYNLYLKTKNMLKYTQAERLYREQT
jgi:hypothetical protein